MRSTKVILGQTKWLFLSLLVLMDMKLISYIVNVAYAYVIQFNIVFGRTPLRLESLSLVHLLLCKDSHIVE